MTQDNSPLGNIAGKPFRDGGAAFPQNSQDDQPVTFYSGMSLRDWLAGQALQGMATMAALVHEDLGPAQGDVSQSTAKAAYEIADAMLKERES